MRSSRHGGCTLWAGRIDRECLLALALALAFVRRLQCRTVEAQGRARLFEWSPRAAALATVLATKRRRSIRPLAETLLAQVKELLHSPTVARGPKHVPAGLSHPGFQH
ncbi:hypothetical protein SKAU_G00044610 [Synaphobranchus kaupii]|uniref:Uncharacterized protein n=1 Tax=Synaphobranchus kaupii TaxID=118154 RepID=A0A9Q1G2L8_SYNKA|nr:hypothetical protein SKAU_G00044610 [Synaphobranchus kaupii]